MRLITDDIKKRFEYGLMSLTGEQLEAIYEEIDRRHNHFILEAKLKAELRLIYNIQKVARLKIAPDLENYKTSIRRELKALKRKRSNYE